MASTNVETFAAELRVPAEVLLEQLRAAGVDKKTPSDPLSEADKERLLSALRASHGGGGENAPRRQKITVVRKQTSEIKQADSTGKARTIQVEVRRKRTFVKRDGTPGNVPAAAAPEPVAAPVAPPPPVKSANSVIDEEQRRLREEEARRQKELMERQARELREKTARLERDRQRENEAMAEASRREEAARAEQERLAKMQADAEREAEAVRAMQRKMREEAGAAAAASAAARDQERKQAEEKAAAEAAERAAKQEAARVAAEEAAAAARKAKEEADATAAARRRAEAEVAAINRLLEASRRPPPPPPPPPETILGAVEPLASVGQAEHLPNELPPSKPVPGAAPPPPGALANNDAEMLSDEDTPAPGPRISRPKYDFSQNIDARAEEIERQSPQERAKKTIFRVQVSAVHDRPTALALKEKLLALNAQYRIRPS